MHCTSGGGGRSTTSVMHTEGERQQTGCPVREAGCKYTHATGGGEAHTPVAAYTESADRLFNWLPRKSGTTTAGIRSIMARRLQVSTHRDAADANMHLQIELAGLYTSTQEGAEGGTMEVVVVFKNT